MSQIDNNDLENSAFVLKRFFIFVFALGIFTWLLSLVFHAIYAPTNILNVWFIGATFASGIIMCMPFILSSAFTNASRAKFTLRIAGFLCPLLVAFFVIMTGGATKSYFTLLFLFLPSAVAIIFKTTNKNNGFIIVCFMCAASYIGIIWLEYFRPPNVHNLDEYNNLLYWIFYSVNILVYVLAIYALERYKFNPEPIVYGEEHKEENEQTN